MAANFVSPHVAVWGQALGLFEGGGVPEARVNPGDRAGGGDQLRPGQAAKLVAISGVPDKLQKKKTVGTAEGGGTRKQPRGQFSTKWGEEPISGEFPLEDAQFSGPLPAPGNVAADLENIAVGITLAGGHHNSAKEAGGTGKGSDQEARGPRGEFGNHDLGNF